MLATHESVLPMQGEWCHLEVAPGRIDDQLGSDPPSGLGILPNSWQVLQGARAGQSDGVRGMSCMISLDTEQSWRLGSDHSTAGGRDSRQGRVILH